MCSANRLNVCSGSSTRRPALVLSALLFAATSASQAQVQAGARARSAVVAGTVTDTAGQPVPSARVGEMSSQAGTLSDSAGRFRLENVRAGMTVLQVRRVGYHPADFSILVPPDSTLRVAIQLIPSAVPLDTLTVSASADNFPGLQVNGFFERMADRRRGGGSASFVTPEEIERRHPQKVTDLLAQLPGSHIVYETRFGHSIAIPYGREAGCLMNVWIDGALISGLYGAPISASPARFPRPGELPSPDRPDKGDMGIDEVVSANEVQAIEVYQSPNEVPARFDVVKNRCGTIVIWTGTRRS
ncbi:MAG: carboxypeptidase regulatory-like domain-containing protein [Gemmatimonadales bacterium]